MKRQRGRGRKPGNQGNRPLESNGPDIKIRGTANQIYDKYMQLARDSQSSGDRVKSENYLQHAEHYFRIMVATMPRERVNSHMEEQENNLNGRDHDDHISDNLKVMDDEDEDGAMEADDAASEEADSREDEEPQAERAAAGQGRNRRRRGRRRNEGEGPGQAAAPQADPDARSALDMLARQQAAAVTN